jgi:hypothetical protein
LRSPFQPPLISSIPCRAIPLSLLHRKCPVRPTIPRIPTSLNFGAEGASTGTPIVLAGPSREHARLRYVPTSLLKGCHGVTLARATLDCLNFCCNCSSTLSVCHGRTTSDAPTSSHTFIRSNYTKRAEQRQMFVHVSFFLQPSCNAPRWVFRIRILYMPPIYAIISFFSYRFFRSYTYYSLAETGELQPSCFSTLRASNFFA